MAWFHRILKMTSYSSEYSCILFRYFSSIEEHLMQSSFCIKPVWELLGAWTRVGVAGQNGRVIMLRLPNHFTFCWCEVFPNQSDINKQAVALPLLSEPMSHTLTQELNNCLHCVDCRMELMIIQWRLRSYVPRTLRCTSTITTYPQCLQDRHD